jgi:2-polyprenyl-3-methyl-5-hydroxy-6-metoxy-1,4-benzoquinol methylase
MLPKERDDSVKCGLRSQAMIARPHGPTMNSRRKTVQESSSREHAWRLASCYDARYYAHNVGCAPCRAESSFWRGVFDGIADAIVAELAPQTVLDAGCGIGLLVSSLRERGVEAWGIDISEYAISHVPEGARGYCSLASVTDELQPDFDLIVCIEVLEHLPARLGREAIENLARHTDRILFSSTPDDFDEPTHVNVQPMNHWVEQFARLGFFRSFDFDAAAMVAPHAMYLVRAGQTPVSVARDYERAYSRALWEINDLRSRRLRACAGRVIGRALARLKG